MNFFRQYIISRRHRQLCLLAANGSERATHHIGGAILALLAIWAAFHEVEAAELALLPPTVVLHGAEAEQRLTVHAVQNGKSRGVWPSQIELRSSNPEIVRIEAGVALPVDNGQAEITAYAGDQTAGASVIVSGLENAAIPSFRNDVLPVLAKAGCNMGACHGALAGKGGFKLSLRGYDPAADYVRIAHESRGRRIELLDPGRSLILAKPTGALPHKGGLRFDIDSKEYRMIANWIAHGAPPPAEGDPRVERLELLPDESVLAAGAQQQILVQAVYTDGRVRDVTRWAKYDATQTSVASVDQQGLVEVVGSGVGAITAWFDSQIAIARIVVPYENQLDEERVLAEAEASDNFIDQQVLARLEQLQLNPSPLADDATFVRRAYLDAIGTLPTAEEVRIFLADARPDKRERLIDDLLAREEFVDYWAYKWSDVLLVNGQLLRPAAVKAYYLWIRDQVEANRPWDEFVRAILTAQGGSLEDGATNFYALHQDPESLTENVCQAFLGLSIGCAKCHNHPLEKWTNDQYYAMANLFARVRGKGWGGDPRQGDGERTVYVAAAGDLLQPSTGEPQPPTPLDGQPLDLQWPGDRRVPLADWLTSPENPYFARAIANRIWANFLGVGLVEEVDDLRASNPASNEKLLAALADYLVDQDFDLQALIRKIMRSRTYQRSSVPMPGSEAERRFYSHYYPRRMQAEVLLDAISQVTGVPTEFTQIEFPSSDKYDTDFYPKGTRALQLYDSAVMSHFLSSFGRNPRTITCECERSTDPSIVQVLHLSNGDTINEKLREAENRVAVLLETNATDKQLIEEAYLIALARAPRDKEMEQIALLFANVGESERRHAVEDLFWSLLTSREFLFNH